MKRAYTSILGHNEGAKRLHLHLTEIVPEVTADRSSHYTHSHVAEEAFYVLEGEATFRLVDGKRTVKAGEMIFFPSQTTHGEFDINSDHLRYLVLRTIEEDDPPCCCGGDK